MADIPSVQLSETLAIDDPVIVLSMGRSGSTLLMRLLNCSADIIIWGEHNGFLSPIAAAFGALTGKFASDCFQRSSRFIEPVLKQQPIILSQGEQWSCEWANAFDKNDIVYAFRNLLLQLFARRLPNGVRWGFKEIRYSRKELEFLRALFARAQFILLLRNPVAVLQSISRHFKPVEPKRTAQYVINYLQFLELVEKQLQEQRKDVLVCHYELLTRELEHQLTRLEHFLGISLARASCEAIMSERESVPRPSNDIYADLLAFVEKNAIDLDRQKLMLITDRYRALLNATTKQQNQNDHA